jgi:RNA polymerase I-specific transcription initiation factor RRN7
LHGLSARLARLLRSQFGIATPEVNAGPVLWRSVRALGGDATLYTATKRAARMLKLPLTLEPRLAPARGGRAPPTHALDEAPPELALMGAAVVVLKLAYGLDGHKRYVPLYSTAIAYLLL